MVAGVVVLGVVSLLFLASPVKCQLGFEERDYSLFEDEDPGNRPIVISKDGVENTGDITISLQYLTLDEYLSTAEFQSPLDNFDLVGLDPAEMMDPVLPDDFETVPTSLTIPPSPGFRSVTFNTSIITDTIHELLEAFFIRAVYTFDNDADRMVFEDLEANNNTNNIALIRILNDDIIFFGYERRVYELSEGSGTSSILFGKLNDVNTEVVLTLMIQIIIGSTNTVDQDLDVTLDPVPPAIFTFQTDEVNQLINLTVTDDDILELVEMFSMTLFKNESVPGVNVDPMLGVAEISILDNEFITLGFIETVITVSEDVNIAQIGLQITNIPFVSSEYANAGFGYFPTFFTVDTNVSAVDPEDYTSTTTSISIAFSAVLGTFDLSPSIAMVMITDDNIPENTEELALGLNLDPVNVFADRNIVVIDPAAAVLIINDNDATPSVIGFIQDLYNTTEGGPGFVEICVSVITPVDRTLLLANYEANLTLSLEPVTAEVDVDFGSLTQEFTLTRDAPDQCFNVTIIDDDILEIVEYFRATITAVGNLPQNASLGTTEARVNIIDDESAIVGFQPENVTVTEGDDNFAIVNVLFISPTNISSGVFTQLSVFTVDGTATAGNDYQAVNTTVLLQGGVLESQQIMIVIEDDIIVEDNETFSLSFTIDMDSGNIETYDPSLATITILDFDVPAEVVVGFERDLYPVNEDGGAVEICAAVLNPNTGQRLSTAELMTLDPGFVVTFNFSLAEMTALVGVDYTDLFASFSLTPSNPIMCFSVPIINDTVFELTEYFSASLDLDGSLPGGASLGITAARVQIEDDEVAVIGFREDLLSVNESVMSVTLYVEFRSPSEISSDIEVNITLVTIDDSALEGSDYEEEEEMFTLIGGSFEVFHIDLGIIDDSEPERPESESFNVQISSTSPLISQQRLTFQPNSAVVIIIDNDEFVPAVVGFERSLYNVTEGDGEVEVCVAILTPADPTTLNSGYNALLNFTTADDTAIDGADYDGISGVIVSLTQTSPRLCFNISILNDNILEISEDFLGQLVLVAPVPPSTILGTPETRISIIDDETAIIGFDNTDVEVLESAGTAQLTISLLPSMISSNVEIEFSLNTADNTAIAGSDYVQLTVDFDLTGGTGNSFEANVMISNDNMQEIPTRENLTATLTLVSANVPITLSPDTAFVTIIDDDNVTVIGFDPDTFTVGEDVGTVQICAAVLEPSDLSLLDPAFTASVRFFLQDDTAMAASDYVNLDVVLQFTATLTTQCVNVTIVDDEEGETAEDFLARLEPDGFLPAGVTLSPDTASVTILDNEVPSVIGFERVSYTVGEGDGVAEICAAIQSPSDPATLPSSYSAPINISTVAGGNAEVSDDFRSQFGSFVLTPSQPRACINVTIVDDSVLEIDESFSGQLEGDLPPTASFGQDFTTVIIRDNEIGVVGIPNGSFTVEEDVGSVIVVVGFTQPAEISSDIVVNITFFTVDSSAVAGQDYEEVQESFILQRGEEVRGVQVTIIHDDEAGENIETFQTSIQEGSPLQPRITLDPVELNISIQDVPPPPTVVVGTPFPTPTPDTDTGGGGGGMGGDPHYSLMLPTGQLLCFSVHGEKNFPFNLISNSLLQMNAFFIEDARREEITWIGSLGVVVQHATYKKSNATKMRFEAKEQTIYINNGVSLLAKRVEKLTLANGKLTITEGLRRRGDRKPEVEVDLVDVGLHFTVRFVKKRHLDMSWKKVDLQPADSHGIIGQFLRKGVEIDEVRKLLYLPNLVPVPVMRSSVWHFMERESPDPLDQKYCWQAMNPGYQGKMLIEGSYLDYLVDDVLTPGFKFDPKSTEL